MLCLTQDGYWTQVGSRPIRPLDTVVLPPGQVCVVAGLRMQLPWIVYRCHMTCNIETSDAGHRITSASNLSDGFEGIPQMFKARACLQ